MPSEARVLSPSQADRLAELRAELDRHQVRWRALDEARRCATGWAEVDALLGGGFGRGQVTVLAGAPGSGRTSLVARAVARSTGQGDTCAWVDTAKSLGAQALAALGVELSRLLRVCPPEASALWAAALVAGSGAFALVVVDLPSGRVPSAALQRLAEAARAGQCAVVLLGEEALSPAAVKGRLEVSMAPGPGRRARRRVRLSLDKGRTGSTWLLPRVRRTTPAGVWRPSIQSFVPDATAPAYGTLPVAPLTAKLFTRPGARRRHVESMAPTPAHAMPET